MKHKQKELQPNEKVLEITTFFDATAERVFKAWINKKDFANWYGPEGHTVLSCDMEPEVGGAWKACIRSPAGQEYSMKGTYIEIIAPSRLVFTYEDGSGKGLIGQTIVTINFMQVGNQTRMDFHQSKFPTKQMKESHVDGWSSAFKCLHDFILIPQF